MNKGVVGLLSFIGGALTGVGGAFIFFEKKYQKIIDETVKKINETADKGEPTEMINPDVKEEQKPEPVIAEKPIDIPHEEFKPVVVQAETGTIGLENSLQKQAAKVAREKPDIINYNKMIKELNYVPVNDEEDEEYSQYPYLITDDKIPFGEKTDPEGNPYTKTTLIYYDDGVVADTTYEIIDDVNDIIGTDSLGHFGEFHNRDSIYVRNDRLRTDFEVCLSQLSWEGDILQRMPYLRGIS